jgi:hypothetical protein
MDAEDPLLMSIKRGRGRPPETWKHEIYALIVTALAPGQEWALMEHNFSRSLDRILYGDPPASPGSKWDDSYVDDDIEHGVVEDAKRRGAAPTTIARLEGAVQTIELNRSKALRLLRRLLKQRSTQAIRWRLEERELWKEALGHGPDAAKNEARQPCSCRPCRDAAPLLELAVAMGTAALAKKGWSPDCVRGGPGLATWERGAWRVACLLLGDDHAPKSFKVMQEKARGHE